MPGGLRTSEHLSHSTSAAAPGMLAPSLPALLGLSTLMYNTGVPRGTVSCAPTGQRADGLNGHGRSSQMCQSVTEKGKGQRLQS